MSSENNKTAEGFYTGELNSKRIKKYLALCELFNVSESTIRDVFSEGINFACHNYPDTKQTADLEAEVKRLRDLLKQADSVMSGENNWHRDTDLGQSIHEALKIK